MPRIFFSVFGLSETSVWCEHPDALQVVFNLAWTYQNLGTWKDGEDLFVRVLNYRKRLLGDEHPDTLHSILHLTAIYDVLG